MNPLRVHMVLQVPSLGPGMPGAGPQQYTGLPSRTFLDDAV